MIIRSLHFVVLHKNQSSGSNRYSNNGLLADCAEQKCLSQ